MEKKRLTRRWCLEKKWFRYQLWVEIEAYVKIDGQDTILYKEFVKGTKNHYLLLGFHSIKSATL